MLRTVAVIQEMGKKRGKDKVTAMASRHSRNGKRQRKEKQNYFELLPEELNAEILSRLPLPSVIEARSVCHSWRTIISSSPQFHKMWDEKNSEQWLVMDDCHGGVKIFNLAGDLKKKMFDSPYWVLKAASRGLLLYQHKTEGMLQIVNPLTMEARQLPDPLLGEEHLSFYLKKKTVTIDVIVESTTKTYQVIIFSRLNQAVNLLIYRSSTSSWEIKVVGGSVMQYWAPYKTEGNQTVYCLPLQERAMASYNLCGQTVHAKETYGSELKGFALGKDVKVVLWSSPIGRSFMLIFEMDAEAAASQWRVVSVCRWNTRDPNRISTITFGELLFEKDFVFSSIGASEDCIWAMPAFTHQDVHQTRLLLHQQKDILKAHHRQDESTAFPTPLRFSISP